MNEAFDLCVQFLLWLGSKLGMTYKEINVWIFVIIEPIVFLVMLIYIIWLRRKLKTKA